jgi:hypothetical protein
MNLMAKVHVGDKKKFSIFLGLKVPSFDPEMEK